jgi:hypothetical protein
MYRDSLFQVMKVYVHHLYFWFHQLFINKNLTMNTTQQAGLAVFPTNLSSIVRLSASQYLHPIKTSIMKKIFFLAFIALNGIYAGAQARWQADVSITSVTISPLPTIQKQAKLSNTVALPNTGTQKVPVVTAADANLKCSITIHNENDDDAKQAMVVVILPVEVTVISKPQNATLFTAGAPYGAYLVFSLGNMAVQQNITVEFTFTKSQYGNKVGAYAYSSSPDPNPANNYKDATY